MHALVPDNPFLAYLFTAGLKLRLNQAHNLAILCKKVLHRPQHLGQGDEGYVDTCEHDPVPDITGQYIADIRLFHTDNPLVIPEFPCQLSVSHVHAVHLNRPVLEHAVRKSPGGGSHIHAYLAFKPHAKMAHGLFQLKSSPAYISERISPDLNLGRSVKGGAGFIFLLSVYINDSRHNQCLGLFPGPCQVFLHHKHIQPFFHYSSHPPAFMLLMMESLSIPSPSLKMDTLPCST